MAGSRSSGSEKQWRITVPRNGWSAAAVAARRGAAVDHDRQPERLRERELPVEQRTLLLAACRRRGGRRALSPPPRRPSDARAAPQLADAARLRRCCAMRVDAECRDDAIVIVGDLERARGTSRFPSRSSRSASTPAAFARATTASGSAHASRCACVSVTPRSRARPRAGRAALRPRCPSTGCVRPYATSSQATLVG